MKKWLNEVKASLAEALSKSEGGDIPLKNLYMIAPILYSEKFNCNNEELFQEMIDANDKQVTSDWALDENSKSQYKFHYVSSYLYCFVVADKFDEFKYNQIMEYVCSKMDLFTDDYDGKTEPANIFKLIPADLTEEVFETIVHGNNIKIERIISNGHTSPDTGWYDQKQNEWILILKGNAIITFEGDKEIRLNEGSYLDIPAHTKHQVSWTSPKTETIWLAIYYSD